MIVDGFSLSVPEFPPMNIIDPISQILNNFHHFPLA